MGQQQRERVLRGRDHVGLGCVHDHDTAAGRSLHVHVVQTDARASDHAEPFSRLEHVSVHMRLRADDQGLVLTDLRSEVAGRELRADIHLEVAPEQLETLL